MKKKTPVVTGKISYEENLPATTSVQNGGCYCSIAIGRDSGRERLQQQLIELLSVTLPFDHESSRRIARFRATGFMQTSHFRL